MYNFLAVYVNKIINYLDFIHCPNFLNDVSDTLRNLVSYLRMETEFIPRNVISNKIMTMDNVQNIHFISVLDEI
jgi:hypothetical protein